MKEKPIYEQLGYDPDPPYSVPKPTTNADRIRGMSDEELAEWLAAYNERSVICPNFGAHDCQATCYQCWLDWLKQEANV